MEKVGTDVENDKNVDSYPVTPILPLVVVLANPVNVTVFSRSHSLERLYSTVANVRVWFGKKTTRGISPAIIYFIICKQIQ